MSKLQLLCSAAHTSPDTPTLIRVLAGDADFVRLCKRLVEPLDGELEHRLRTVCHEHGFNTDRIYRRLLGAARALQLEPSYDGLSDYYGVLGVSADADSRAIKHAFREKAKILHPDRNGVQSEAFLQLHQAYRHLSDSGLRRRSDREQQKKGKWIEAGSRSANQRRASRLFFLIGIVAAMLAGLAFIFDLCYREISFF